MTSEPLKPDGPTIYYGHWSTAELALKAAVKDLDTAIAAFETLHKIHLKEMPGHEVCLCPVGRCIDQIKERWGLPMENVKPSGKTFQGG